MLVSKKWLSLLTVSVAGSLILAGCTSGKSTGNSTSQESSTPKKGGTLTIVQSADINTKNLMGQNNPNFSIEKLIYNTLIHYNHKTLKPEPELATSWKVSSDNRTITFNLQSGVKYHSGADFTANDVIGTIKYMQLPTTSSQTKSIAMLITHMVANNPHQVTLTLDHPVSNLFDLFEMMPMINPSNMQQTENGKTFDGTGPFVVDSYTPGVGVELSKFKGYWQKGEPYLDHVDINIVKSSQGMLSSLKSGQSQLALDLEPLDAVSIKNNPQYQLVQSDAQDNTLYVASNVKTPLLSDKAVRQAISYSIDRKRILSQVMGGIGEASDLPWSPDSPAYDKSLNNFYTYNASKAKSLLKKAGAAGKSVNVYYNSGFAPAAGAAQIIVFDLKQAGLNPVAQPQQAATFLTNLQTGNFDGLFVQGHGFGQLHPSILINGSFPFNASKNASNFDNATYKELAANIATTTDPSKQKSLLHQLNKFLLDQQFLSDLVVSSHTYTISSKVKGLQWNMLDDLVLDKTYIEK